MIIFGNIRTGTVNSEGRFSVNISNVVEDTIISVLQSMNDKEDSDIETIVVQKGKGIQPSVNPVDSDDTSISGTGTSGSIIIVKIDGVRRIQDNSKWFWKLGCFNTCTTTRKDNKGYARTTKK